MQAAIGTEILGNAVADAAMDGGQSTLHTGEHEDFCNKCKIGGKLVCCDFCPKVYHLSCVDPKLNDIPPDVWACPSCASRMYLTKQDLKTVILSRRVAQVLKKNYKQSGLEAVQSMLRVMQAASVLQRDDVAPGQYARAMRQDMFGDIVHEHLRGVYQYSSMWCAILRLGPFVRFLGMFDEAERAYEEYERARNYFEPVLGELKSVTDSSAKLRLERRPSTVAVISSKFKLVLGDPTQKQDDIKPALHQLGDTKPAALQPFADQAAPPVRPTTLQPFNQPVKDTQLYPKISGSPQLPAPSRARVMGQHSSAPQLAGHGQRYLPPYETPQTPVSLEAVPQHGFADYAGVSGGIPNGHTPQMDYHQHHSQMLAQGRLQHNGQTTPQFEALPGWQTSPHMQQLGHHYPQAQPHLQQQFQPQLQVQPQAQARPYGMQQVAQQQYPAVQPHHSQHFQHVQQPQYPPPAPQQQHHQHQPGFNQPYQTFQPQQQQPAQYQHHQFQPNLRPQPTQNYNGYSLPAIPQAPLQVPSPQSSVVPPFQQQQQQQQPASFLQQLEEPLDLHKPASMQQVQQPQYTPVQPTIADGVGAVQGTQVALYQQSGVNYAQPQASMHHQPTQPLQHPGNISSLPQPPNVPLKMEPHAPTVHQPTPALPQLQHGGAGLQNLTDGAVLPLEPAVAGDYDFDSFDSISELEDNAPDTLELALALVDSQFASEPDSTPMPVYPIGGQADNIGDLPSSRLSAFDGRNSMPDQATSSSVSPQSSSTTSSQVVRHPQGPSLSATRVHQVPRPPKKGRRRQKGEGAPVRKRVKTIVAGPGAWGVKLERDISDGDTDTLTRAERRKRQLRGFYSPPAVGPEYQATIRRCDALSIQADIPEWEGPRTAGERKEEDYKSEHDALYSPAESEPERVKGPLDGLQLSEEDILLAREAFILFEDDLVSVRHTLKWPMHQVVTYYYRVWQLSPLGYVMQQLRNQRSIELLIKRGSGYQALYGVRSSKRSK